MKLRPGSIVLGLEPRVVGDRVAWIIKAEFFPTQKTTECIFDERGFESEPSYESFVTTVGELVAQLAGEPA